jgi:hypothetical protein
VARSALREIDRLSTRKRPRQSGAVFAYVEYMHGGRARTRRSPPVTFTASKWDVSVVGFLGGRVLGVVIGGPSNQDAASIPATMGAFRRGRVASMELRRRRASIVPLPCLAAPDGP